MVADYESVGWEGIVYFCEGYVVGGGEVGLIVESGDCFG